MSFDRDALAACIAAHGAAVRVLVAATAGSAPRDPGTAMLVWEDGQSVHFPDLSRPPPTFGYSNGGIKQGFGGGGQQGFSESHGSVGFGGSFGERGGSGGMGGLGGCRDSRTAPVTQPTGTA